MLFYWKRKKLGFSKLGTKKPSSTFYSFPIRKWFQEFFCFHVVSFDSGSFSIEEKNGCIILNCVKTPIMPWKVALNGIQVMDPHLNATLYFRAAETWRIQHPFGRNLVPNMLSSSWKWINQFGNWLYKQTSCALSLSFFSTILRLQHLISLVRVECFTCVCVISKVNLIYC